MKDLRILLVLLAFLALPTMAMALDVSNPHFYFKQYLGADKAEAGRSHIPEFSSNTSSSSTFQEYTLWRSGGEDDRDNYLFYKILDKYEGGSTSPKEAYYFDAFSFSNDISTWLALGKPGLFYSVIEDPNTDPDDLDNNTNIRTRMRDDSTSFTKYGTDRNNNDSIGIDPETITISSVLREANLCAYDFMHKDPGKAGGAYDTRLYFSSAKKAKFDGDGNISYVAHSGYSMDPESGPWERWGNRYTGPAGSGYDQSGHEADVLCLEISDKDDWSYHYSNATIFEHAWVIAAVMLRDLKDYNPGSAMDDLLAGTLVWDTIDGRVEDLGGVDQNLDFYDNFMRYVFDISGVVVQDVDLDGEFDIGSDYIVFSVNDDGRFSHSQEWGGDPNSPIATDYDGDYFEGDHVFLYTGSGITDIGEISGTDQIDALDIMVPEPGTIMMVIGGALALAVGVIRKKFHSKN